MTRNTLTKRGREPLPPTTFESSHPQLSPCLNAEDKDALSNAGWHTHALQKHARVHARAQGHRNTSQTRAHWPTRRLSCRCARAFAQSETLGSECEDTHTPIRLLEAKGSSPWQQESVAARCSLQLTQVREQITLCTYEDTYR